MDDKEFELRYREPGKRQRSRAPVRQFFPETGTAFFFLCCALLCTSTSIAQERVQSVADQNTTIRVDATRPIKSFDPDVALGTSIDILPQGVVDKIYTPAILKESLSAGWGPITYRQNTELQGAAWHWNPNGIWSDPTHQSGYFTAAQSSASPSGILPAIPCPIVATPKVTDVRAASIHA